MYRVKYADIPNAGDQLNIYIMKRIFHIDMVCADSPLNTDIVGIGSCLRDFYYNKRFRIRVSQVLRQKNVIHVWGTGFLYEEKEKNPRFFRNMIFHALRGELSKQRVEKITKKPLGDIPLCDGGILTSELFDHRIEKKYELGIIPHFREQDEPLFQEMKRISKRSVLINLREDPIKVCEKIGSCDYILSSSLHGLIIADSFHIPNLHIKVSNKPLGDGFKFRDYYSGYGLDTGTVDANIRIPSLNDIIDNYRIEPSVVEQKKSEMYQCFPFKG